MVRLAKKAATPAPQGTVVAPTKSELVASPDPVLAAELSRANQQVAALTREKDSLGSQLAAVRKERDATNSLLRQDNELLTTLQPRIVEGEKLLSQATSTADKAQNERDQTIASLMEQQNRLQSLETDLKNARAALEQERELNSAAHDVRELMGARNLHIVDVYDAENEAGSVKSFGRVIYTEGKSLIFYAFDLDQKRRGRKVSFQAWGESGGKHEYPRSLGVFYIDDEVQRRWVLKVSDVDKLKAIDTVFVTVESTRKLRNRAASASFRRISGTSKPSITYPAPTFRRACRRALASLVRLRTRRKRQPFSSRWYKPTPAAHS